MRVESSREREEDLARIAAAIAEPAKVLVIEGEAGILAQALDANIELPLDARRIAALGARALAPHVRARLSALPTPAGEVAQAAAVLDSDVAPRQLAALTGLTLSEVREACDQLVRNDRASESIRARTDSGDRRRLP